MRTNCVIYLLNWLWVLDLRHAFCAHFVTSHLDPSHWSNFLIIKSLSGGKASDLVTTHCRCRLSSFFQPELWLCISIWFHRFSYRFLSVFSRYEWCSSRTSSRKRSDSFSHAPSLRCSHNLWIALGISVVIWFIDRSMAPAFQRPTNLWREWIGSSVLLSFRCI